MNAKSGVWAISFVASLLVSRAAQGETMELLLLSENAQRIHPIELHVSAPVSKIFSVPRDNSVGSCESPKGMRVFTLNKNDLIESVQFSESFEDGDAGDVCALAPHDGSVIVAQCRRIVAFDFRQSVVHQYIACKKLEETITAFDVMGMQPLRVLAEVLAFSDVDDEIDEPVVKYRVVEVSSQGPSFGAEIDAGVRPKVSVAAHFITDGTFCRYDAKIGKFASYNAELKPIEHPFARLFTAYNAQWGKIALVCAHPTLPWVMIVDSKHNDGYRLWLVDWKQAKKEPVLLARCASAIKFGGFSPDGNCFIVGKNSKTGTSIELFLWTISGKNSGMVEGEKYLGDIDAQVTLASFAWATNPHALVLADGYRLLWWRLNY